MQEQAGGVGSSEGLEQRALEGPWKMWLLPGALWEPPKALSERVT